MKIELTPEEWAAWAADIRARNDRAVERSAQLLVDDENVRIGTEQR